MIIICIQQSYLKRYKFCQIGQEKDKKKIKGGGLVLDEGGGRSREDLLMYLSKYIWHKYKGDYLKNKFNDRNQVDDKIVRRLYRWKVSIFSFKFFSFPL
jgi:hypothetical protein